MAFTWASRVAGSMSKRRTLSRARMRLRRRWKWGGAGRAPTTEAATSRTARARVPRPPALSERLPAVREAKGRSYLFERAGENLVQGEPGRVQVDGVRGPLEGGHRPGAVQAVAALL